MPWHGGQPTGWIPEQDAADVRQWRGRRPEATPRQSLPLAATLSGVCGLQTGGAGGDVSLGLILAYRGMIPLLSVIPRWLCRFQGPAWAELYMEVEHFSMLLANSPRIFIMFGHSLTLHAALREAFLSAADARILLWIQMRSPGRLGFPGHAHDGPRPDYR